MKLSFIVISFLLLGSGVKAEFLYDNFDYSLTQNWQSLGKSHEVSVKRLLSLLSKSETGKGLVDKYLQHIQYHRETPGKRIIAGDISITDSSLVRKFSVSDPLSVNFERKSVIYLGRDLNIYEALRDLAHELNHFLFQDYENPYHRNFNMVRFIKRTIKGKGGEANAFVTECRITKELFLNHFMQDERCKAIYNAEAKSFNSKKAVNLFYNLGDYYKEFFKALDNDTYDSVMESFPLLNDKENIFISQAYGLPYPLAIMKEYYTMINKVCTNEKKRLDLIENYKSVKDENSLKEVKLAYIQKCQNKF